MLRNERGEHGIYPKEPLELLAGDKPPVLPSAPTPRKAE